MWSRHTSLRFHEQVQPGLAQRTILFSVTEQLVAARPWQKRQGRPSFGVVRIVDPLMLGVLRTGLAGGSLHGNRIAGLRWLQSLMACDFLLGDLVLVCGRGFGERAALLCSTVPSRSS